MLWTLLALAIAQPASASVEELPNLRLSANSAAVIRRSGTAYVLSSEASSELPAGEREMLEWTLRRPGEAMGPNAVLQNTEREVQPLFPDSLRFSLIEHDGEMVLTIQNGLTKSFTYNARVGRGSESMVTDVCQLLPQQRSFEHWPYHFDWIEITNLQVVDYRQGDPPRCE